MSKCDPTASVDDDEEDNDESTDKSPLLVSVDASTSSASTSRASGVFARLTREIEALLLKLTDVNNRMTSISENIRSSSATYTLQRHRDILNDYTKEYRKTKANVEANHEREHLFFSNSQNEKKALGETRIQINNKASDILNKEMESARKYVFASVCLTHPFISFLSLESL